MLAKSIEDTPTPEEPEAPTPEPVWLKTVETAIRKGIQHGADAMEKPLEAVKPHIKDAVEKGMAVASAAYLLCSDTDVLSFLLFNIKIFSNSATCGF